MKLENIRHEADQTGSRSIYKAFSYLMLFTLTAKLLGFVREMLTAAYFGAGQDTDSLFLANGFVSNILYAITTAVAVAFLPIYVERLRSGREESSRFASNVICVMTTLSVIVCAGVVLGAPLIARVVAPTYNDSQRADVTLYFRILSVGIIFILVTNLLKSILDAEKKYGYGAFSGIIYSVTAIAFIMLFHVRMGVMSLAISIPAAYLLQFLVLTIRTRKVIHFTPGINLRDAEIRRLLRLSLPILLSNATVELNQLIDRILASMTKTGSVSSLSYALTLTDFVSAIVTMSLITVLYTEIAQNAATNDNPQIKRTLYKGISIMAVVILPISLISVVLSADIVRIAFGRGKFSDLAVSMTAGVLVFFGIGFLFNGLQGLFTKTFYSLKDSRTPTKYAIISVAANILFSVLLFQFMGLPGIALASTLACIICTTLLFLSLQKRLGDLGKRRLLLSLSKILVSLAAVIPVALLVKSALSGVSVYIRFVLVTIAVGIIYLLLLILMKCDVLMPAVEWIRSRKK